MLNYKMQQFREAGLIDKWIDDKIESFGRLETAKTTETRRSDALTIYDLQGAFIVCGAALGFSLMCILFEILLKILQKI